MISRPTDDEVMRFGVRQAMHRAMNRNRGSEGWRGPGGRRGRVGAVSSDPLLTLFGAGEADGLYIDWSNVDLVSTDIDVAYDASPHARNFTAVTRPAYTAADSDFGNRPSATFAAATVEYLVAAATSVLELDTDEVLDVVALTKGTATGGSNGRVIDKRSSNGWNFGYQSTTGISTIYDTDLGAGSSVQTFAAVSAARTDVALVRGLYNPSDAGGTYYARINGTAGTGTTTGQGGNPNTADSCAIGANDNGSLPFDGKCALLIARVGATNFSAPELALILAQVNERYGTSFTGV